MRELLRWLGGIFVALAGLLGLYIGAHAEDAAFAFFGFMLTLFSVLMLGRLIVLATEAGGARP